MDANRGVPFRLDNVTDYGALQPHFVEACSMLIAATNADLQGLLADVATITTNAQWWSREQRPVVNATPELPDLMFTRPRLLLDSSQLPNE